MEPGRTQLDAWATMRMEGEPGPGELALCHEEVLVDIGEHHLTQMDTIVDPLVVSDLATVVWSPHGHPEAVDSLLRLAQVVLIDSEMEPDPAAAAKRARELEERAYVVDLAWLRSTPWRERVAATFDPDDLAPGAVRDQRGHGTPPARLGDHRRALLRLARLPAGVEGRGPDAT